MRALIATTGSDGDIRPFYALAKELMARGHDVLFTAPDHYTQGAADQGIAFRKFGPPWSLDEMGAIFTRVLARSNPLAQLQTVIDAIAEPERQAIPELLAMAAEADVVIYPPLLVAAAAAARAKNVPHVSVQLTPVYRARNYGPTGNDHGPLLNGVQWSLASWLLRRATDPQLNTIVQAAGLAPWRNVLFEAATSTLLDLVAVSAHVIPRDPGWPAASQVTGYWFLDDQGFVPDPALASFVEGERPVVVGFGSMLGFDAEARTRVILEAVRDLPQKVVVLAGWAELGGAEVPANVHVARFVPHSWLFARAACVVHHGGAGTTAAAFRAGVPQAIVWHLGDQPTWAKKARALGVSPGSVFFRKLTAPWLRRQIDRMISDTAMQEAARALGEAIRQERGLTAAADAIERLRL